MRCRIDAWRRGYLGLAFNARSITLSGYRTVGSGEKQITEHVRLQGEQDSHQAKLDL
jgi:hypothetical protein